MNKTDVIKKDHTEGPVATAIESQTAKLPSDLFLWSGFGAIAGGAALLAAGRRHEGNFLAQLAPVMLILGLYNKLVKLEGHDHKSN